MDYLIFSLGLILLFFGLTSFLKPLKFNKIIDILAYLFPFWIWGFIYVFLFVIFWKLGKNFNNNIIFLFFLFAFLLKGLFLIFYPKRKIKKIIERWQAMPNEIKKIQGLIYITLSFLIFTLIF